MVRAQSLRNASEEALEIADETASADRGVAGDGVPEELGDEGRQQQRPLADGAAPRLPPARGAARSGGRSSTGSTASSRRCRRRGLRRRTSSPTERPGRAGEEVARLPACVFRRRRRSWRGDTAASIRSREDRPAKILAIDAERGRARLKRGPKLPGMPLPRGADSRRAPTAPTSSARRCGGWPQRSSSWLDADGRYSAPARHPARGRGPADARRRARRRRSTQGMPIVDELRGDRGPRSTAATSFIQGPPGSGKTYTRRAADRRLDRARASGSASPRPATRRSTTCWRRSRGWPPTSGVAFRGLKKSAPATPSPSYESEHDRPTSSTTTTALTDPASSSRRHSLALLPRGGRRHARLPVHRRGGPGLARRRAGDGHRGAQHRPARRPAAAPAGHAGRRTRRAPALSVLEHLLGDRQTIPPERGLFLEQTWRMHPDVAEFISELMYEGRLSSAPGCERQRVDAGGDAHRDRACAGFRSSTRATPQSLAEEAERDRRGGRAAAGRRDATSTPRAIEHDLTLDGHPGRHPLQRPGALPRGAPAGGRAGRHRRQVPGPGGAGRLLLDGDLERRRGPPQPRVPVQPQPPERRDLAGPLPGGARRKPASCSRSSAGRSSRCGS